MVGMSNISLHFFTYAVLEKNNTNIIKAKAQMYFIGNSKDFAGDVTLLQFTWSTNEYVNLQQCPTNCSRYKGGVPVDPLSAPGKYKIENKYGVHSLIISRLVDWKLFCYHQSII